MEIVVLTKRVPVTQEEELRIVQDGKAVDLSKLPWKMNDWDNYAVEEAVRIVEKTGGSVTAVAIGDAESDEVLRRAIAMGASGGTLIQMDGETHDPVMRARIAANFLSQEKVAFDALFAGVQAEDDQFACMGGILAGILKVPFASMVIGVDEIATDHLVVRRELEGGLQERVRVGLPGVFTVQTGINEPRYVSIMGVRKASKVERKTCNGADFCAGLSPLVEVVRWSYPPKMEGATMITGELKDACTQLVAILKEKGVYQ